MKFLLLIIMLVGNMLAFEIKKNNEKIEINYEYVNDKYTTSDRTFFDDKTYIMIKFNEVTPELVNTFEKKYNLELQKIMIIGYYIYKSDLSPIEIIPKLIDEENVNSVKPKWKRLLNKR